VRFFCTGFLRVYKWFKRIWKNCLAFCGPHFLNCSEVLYWSDNGKKMLFGYIIRFGVVRPVTASKAWKTWYYPDTFSFEIIRTVFFIFTSVKYENRVGGDSGPFFLNMTIIWSIVICGLLGNYTASCGNYLPTFRDNVSVPSSRVKIPRRKERWQGNLAA
jgi:hypothetical protein